MSMILLHPVQGMDRPAHIAVSHTPQGVRLDAVFLRGAGFVVGYHVESLSEVHISIRPDCWRPNDDGAPVDCEWLRVMYRGWCMVDGPIPLLLTLQGLR